MKRLLILMIRLLIACLLFPQAGPVALFAKTQEPIKMTPLTKRKDTGAVKMFSLMDDGAMGIRFAGKPLTKEKLEVMNYASSLSKELAAHGVC